MRQTKFLKSGLMLLIVAVLFPLMVWAATAPTPSPTAAPAKVEAVKAAEALPAAPVVTASPAPTEPQITPPTSDEIGSLIKSLGGLKGASTLAIIALIIQGLMLAFRSQLGEFAGKWRFLLVAALTWVAGAIALKIQGVDWMAAMAHPATMASFQVFIHQAVKQFMTEKGNQA